MDAAGWDARYATDELIWTPDRRADLDPGAQLLARLSAKVSTRRPFAADRHPQLTDQG